MLLWYKQREEEHRIAFEKRKAEEAKWAQSRQQKASTTTTTGSDEDEVFVFVEEMPKFPGGDSALYMYLCMNLNYPEEARDSNIEGYVVISFTVEKDGSVSNVRCLRDIGGECGHAAVEVVKAMPRWAPGKQHGKAVRTQFTLPVHFSLSDENDTINDMSQEVKCQFLLNQSDYKK